MRKRLLKLAAWGAASLGTLAVLFVIVVQVRSRRTFDAPYPEIHASSDPAVIARGKYLAYGPGHCVVCHTSGDEQKKVFRDGAEYAMAGGNEFKLPVGSFFTPNLTPDRETGIGRYSDAELARVIRYGVMPDGRAAIPFMTFHHMSDDDLTALISFLRSQQPVRRAVPQHRPNFLGKTILAFVIEPTGPTQPVPKHSPAQAATVERGAYLANNVAGCVSCHTRRNMVDGSYETASFAGGSVFTIDDDPQHIIVSPNLTPAKTGRITAWSEEQFVGRFDVGMGIRGTHMPWKQFQAMTETDKRALYRYLRTLPPAANDPGPSLQKKKA